MEALKRRQLLKLAATAPVAAVVPLPMSPALPPAYVFVKRHLQERLDEWKRLGILAPNADLYIGDMYDVLIVP